MPKIKDDVDLKELENFGYMYNPDRNVYIGAYYRDNGYNIDFKRIEIGEDRNIFIFGRSGFLVKYKPKYIKKLIQAGLVERDKDKEQAVSYFNKSLYDIDEWWAE